jgi:acetoin utilization protein AcuC
MATPEELATFHDAGYIAALQRVERDQRASKEDRERYNLGLLENPVFPEMFRRPATACGGSMEGARLIRDGGIVYNPAGGTHHGRPGRASGFCYFNDPVLGILTLLESGLERIYYVDVDAHHGDGVEDAFATDDRVFTVSVHEAGRWPFTGDNNTPGLLARNLPVPRGFNDNEMAFIVEQVLLPLGRAFRPQAVVLQCGADALADDPLSRLTLSNNALWHVAESLKDLAPRYLVLGGGGYNPWSVARCWSGVWATLNGFEIPERLPDEARSLLRGISWSRSQGRNPPKHWFNTLRDRPREGPVRDDVCRMVDLANAA